MVLDDLRRRSVLGGISGLVAGLAGCNTDDAPAGTGGSPGDTETTNGRTRTTAEVPPHSHSGDADGGSSLAPAELTVTAFRQAPDLVVYERDGMYRALEGASEREVFSGTDATAVIQHAVDHPAAGTVALTSGVYEIGPARDENTGGVNLRSNVRLVGAGPGATVLKLRDGIDGQRGRTRVSPLVVGEGVSDVTIEHLEIDGNESGNRGVPPYPKSPHHHGIVIHGSGGKVPESRKPSNVLVRNVRVHDTVRSNVVLAGRNCTLADLRLANSATDHWLYMAGATNCTVRGIHASGFARNEGIVLGVGRRRCSGNTISGVKVSNIAETPYANDEPSGLGGRYPVRSVIFRPSSGNAYDNTLRDVDVSVPDAQVGQYVETHQPNTRIRNVNYRGPVGRKGTVNVAAGATGTTVRDSNVDLTPTDSGVAHAVLGVRASDVSLSNITVRDGADTDRQAIGLGAPDGPLKRVTVRDVTVAAGSAALTANGERNPIEGLYVENLRDVNDAGVVTSGDVDFVNRTVY